MAASLLGNINATAGFPMHAELAALILNAAILVGIGVFVYAVMRHRILDFGLAVNRTLVFAIVGAILIAAFQAANRFATVYLHFDDEIKTLLLSAILAAAVYLSFTSLKKVVERIVDRLFFGRWAKREDDLKRFVAEAKHVRDPDALSTLTVAALDRFTGGRRRGALSARRRRRPSTSPRDARRRAGGASAPATRSCSRCRRTARRGACASVRRHRRPTSPSR